MSKLYLQQSVQVAKRIGDPDDTKKFEYARATASHKLLERMLQQAPDKCITIWPARKVFNHQDEYAKGDFTTLVAHGIIHELEANKCLRLTNKEVEKLVTDFVHEHYEAPTHLLLPPDVVYTDIYYIYRRVTYDPIEEGKEACTQVNPPQRDELKVIPNSPVLAVAIL